MTGIAVGQMGLSLETFLGLTPQQFEMAYEKFMERIEVDDIQADRRARMMVLKIIAPPKGKFNLFDLWPVKGDDEIKRQQREGVKPSTQGRREKLKRKWGDPS